MTERANINRDSINYFPPGADRACRIGFFSDPTKPMQDLAYDEVELNSQRACVGRLHFHLPGGIQYGNYNLDVQFANSVVRVPMKIMTKDEGQGVREAVERSEEKEQAQGPRSVGGDHHETLHNPDHMYCVARTGCVGVESCRRSGNRRLQTWSRSRIGITSRSN
jgi:hypothetical protein